MEVTSAAAYVDYLSPDDGSESGGATVSIRGESLFSGPEVTVRFADVNATIVSKTHAEIGVVAPAHPLEPDPESFDIVAVTLESSAGTAVARDFYWWED